MATTLAAAFLLPDATADYAGGAIAITTLWSGATAVHWMDGMANHRLGLAGEELTADELQKLRKHGWRVVHHVMLEKSDIDPAVLGLSGFFAVDSKYRTDGRVRERASANSLAAFADRPLLSSPGCR